MPEPTIPHQPDRELARLGAAEYLSRELDCWVEEPDPQGLADAVRDTADDAGVTDREQIAALTVAAQAQLAEWHAHSGRMAVSTILAALGATAAEPAPTVHAAVEQVVKNSGDLDALTVGTRDLAGLLGCDLVARDAADGHDAEIGGPA